MNTVQSQEMHNQHDKYLIVQYTAPGGPAFNHTVTTALSKQQIAIQGNSTSSSQQGS